ncbi:MAG: hypothetical protein ACRD8Z_06105 [Nitrososphaeraceae archaeon]
MTCNNALVEERVLLDTVGDNAASSGGRRLIVEALSKQVIDLDPAQELNNKSIFDSSGSEEVSKSHNLKNKHQPQVWKQK